MTWYHGTDSEFNEFDKSQNSDRISNERQEVYFFTKDLEYAKNYGSIILECKLNVINTFDTVNNKDHLSLYKKWLKVEDFVETQGNAKKGFADERNYKYYSDITTKKGNYPFWLNNDWLAYNLKELGFDSMIVSDGNGQAAIGIFNKSDIDIIGRI